MKSKKQILFPDDTVVFSYAYEYVNARVLSEIYYFANILD